MEVPPYALQLARLHYQKGDFRQAREMALLGKTQASEAQDVLLWMECARLIFQSSLELEQLPEIKELESELLEILQQEHPPQILARGQLILGMWLLAEGKLDVAESLFYSSIDLATRSQDFETLARALHASAIHSMYHQDGWTRALELLGKAEILTKELQLTEVEISCGIALSQIYSGQKNYGQALSVLWVALEKARLYGFHYASTNILTLLTLIFKENGETERWRFYSELACKGVTADRYPRLHRILQNLLPTESEGFPITYDFIFDEQVNALTERSKGLIDFKNQHILFELAQMFMRNPGHRFAKDRLIQNIWKQEYQPHIHDNLIYVSIKRLRSLLEPDPESPRYILRDRTGYYLPHQVSVKIENPKEGT